MIMWGRSLLWYVLRIDVDLEGFSGFEVVDFFLRSLSIWMPTMFFISNRAIVEVLSSVIFINTLLVFEPMTHDTVELRKEGTAVFKGFNLS